MNLFQQFLWVIFPYLMLTSFVVGHIYRYNTDQFGWSARSSEILEKRMLKWGSILFHYGIIFAFFGHVAGILVPLWLYEFFGVPDSLYHFGAVLIGGIVGVITLVGGVLLTYRRAASIRVRLHTSTTDWLTTLLLLLVVIQGVYVTIIRNLFIGEFDYRSTIGPWFRGVLMLSPDASLMATVPLSFQFHVLTGFLIFGLWPYTRLVHLWSLPLEYINRSNIIYRARNFDKKVKDIVAYKNLGPEERKE